MRGTRRHSWNDTEVEHSFALRAEYNACVTGEAHFTIETHVGRLIEARVFGLSTREHADEYSEALAREVRRHAGKSPVLCADHRPVAIYPQAAADRLVALFQRMNTSLERVAILVEPTNATILLQLERIVREASFSNRRVFKSAELALEHLAAGLDVTELARARAFLAQHRSTFG